jgi:hypothetical protein
MSADAETRCDLDQRAPWSAAPDELTPGRLDEWYTGGRIHVLPDKPTLAAAGMDGILSGWKPAAPIIAESTRVIGVGSCFAQYFVAWLAENGFNRELDASPHNALLRCAAAFENAAVIAQQFRWAFGELDGSSVKWIAKDKSVFDATDERRMLVRETLHKTDVLILTLGLSEVWYDQETGEPLWRALTKRHYDPRRHVFRVETLADTLRSLESIETLRQRHVPNLKVIYTVSPVRLRATFRPVSAISANSASKAILRGALDEFLRARPELLNRSLFYFPSYEIVQDYFRDPYDVDNRHINPLVAAQVVQCFARHFCDADVTAGVSTRTTSATGNESRMRIEMLESQVAHLQAICEQRQVVIDELAAAAKQRLELVEQLSAECARLQKAKAAA